MLFNELNDESKVRAIESVKQHAKRHLAKKIQQCKLDAKKDINACINDRYFVSRLAISAATTKKIDAHLIEDNLCEFDSDGTYKPFYLKD